MIQEDEHIIYISQAKCAVTSITLHYISQGAWNHEDWYDVEKDCGYNSQMPIFRIIVKLGAWDGVWGNDKEEESRRVEEQREIEKIEEKDINKWISWTYMIFK